ncbi:flagellar basal body-associated protein FliL [Sutcliffiella rhizosphaerae]|uniref:Flagellar protein FliL n=1 Tax=Sutcliffiella rhizosphaerae TaxID=2880967 RepID=A0ABM8YIP1_9BACI|nr:flagellar basal body-associated protein FliL [Sutcliffiella rhizosphaerae]CAG9619704.1 hypothetical protein BACCIP111883_00472 [Sutcliffiella rhizosphaerae]
MFRNKIVNAMIIILLAISLLGVVALISLDIFSADGASEEPSIDDVLKYSVDFEEITTNLKSGGFIRLTIKVQTDGKKARAEIEKRDFQVQNIVIHEISNKSATELNGGKGITQLEEDIQEKLNEIMQDGEVVKVYATSFLLQN